MTLSVKISLFPTENKIHLCAEIVILYQNTVGEKVGGKGDGLSSGLLVNLGPRSFS